MSAKQIIDIGSKYMPDLKTIILAGFGAYVGVRVAIAEINTNISWLKENDTEIKQDIDRHEDAIFNLQKDNYYIKGKLGIGDIPRGKSQGKE